MRGKFLLPFILSLFVLAGLPAAAAEVRLSAAASMADALREMAADFHRKNPAVVLLPNFGSSGSLAKQIAHGAPADIFISANPKWMDHLVTAGKIGPNTVRDFVENSLVVVGPEARKIASLTELDACQRIAMGSPGSVPAGQYAEQAMRAAGVYDRLLAGKKLVMAKDVRQALLYAERGEVDCAFVYRTDALLAEKAVILCPVPGELHDRISYPLGLTARGTENRAARKFYTYLQSREAAKILAQFGFAPGAGTGGQRAPGREKKD